MAQAEGFRGINVAAARDIMSRGDALVLDVRDANSYRRAHMKGHNSRRKRIFPPIFRTRRETSRSLSVVITAFPVGPMQSSSLSGASLRRSSVSMAAMRLGLRSRAARRIGFRRVTGAQRGVAGLSRRTWRSRRTRDVHGAGPGDPLILAARLAPPALVKELLKPAPTFTPLIPMAIRRLWLACVGEISANIQRLDRRRNPRLSTSMSIPRRL